ncbi:NUDIX domain-containing protein [Streptomyces sp. HNM0663]|uniref:NUDIX domain-containing protein n=1 Tax=Streptomyces chengmaiensis TaxID=3040919 RepID=A0ABT6I0X1_9ACTN|nr:NUDIX domain-containing protein [Streptomyces chengmaiensis]MDH2393934.1 NUDIX domain-containing protein [Streptomyces chengmaiensis]
MAAKRSAGLLLFRRGGARRDGAGSAYEVLVGHMGGPFWQSKDAGAWSAPKGECAEGEEPRAAARREFAEELGVEPPDGEWLPLGEARQPGGKTVVLWALEADLDTALVRPGSFTMEWPPRSGRIAEFPELDRVEWLSPQAARPRLVTGQRVFLDRLDDLIRGEPRGRRAPAP